MSTMKRYNWDSAEYAEAFATLLNCCDSRESLYTEVRRLFSNLPADAVAIDWGAGDGDLTRVLLEKAGTVYAVEPNPTMRKTLAVNFPAAQIIDGTIMTADPPRDRPVGQGEKSRRLGPLRHVLPDPAQPTLERC